MNKIYLSAAVNDDGTITIPDFAARGLGYEPGDNVNLALPVTQTLCDCSDNELFLSRCCGEPECSGYTSDGEELNIPARLLCEAAIPTGSDISVLAADGVLLVIATEKSLEDLPLELSCFLGELGISTLSLHRTSGIFHRWRISDE